MLIQAPSDIADGAGGNSRSWTLTGQMQADVTTTGGREFQQAQQTIPGLTHQVRTRYRTDITASMRLSDGSAALQIHAVFDPDGKKRELVLYCSQVAGDVITFPGAANLVPGDIHVAGQGSQIFPGAATVAPASNVGGAGSQIFQGASTVAPATNIGGTGSADQIVADLVAAGLTVVAYYDTRYNVLPPPSSSALVCAWDDRRASTTVGAATFCNLASGYIDCGQYTALRGVSKATIYSLLVTYSVGTLRTWMGRFGTGASSRAWRVQVSNTAKWMLSVGDGSGTLYTWTGANTVTAGTLYRVFVNYDGTQGTDLSKVNVVYSAFDPVAQSWGAEVTDTGASVTAGFPATLFTDAVTESLAIGRDRASSGGSNPWNGVIDDVKIFPSVNLTLAQRADVAANNTGGANWVTPSVWHDLTSMTNRGSTGSANDGVLTGDMNLCTDDQTVGRTMLCGAGSATPTWDSVNKVITNDGLDDFMRCVGGPVTGITQDMAVIVVGVSPQSGASFVTVSVGSTSDALKQSRSTTNLRATSSTVNADIANTTGTRAWMARRTSSGTVTVGNKNGTASEVTASGSIANFVPTTITIGADRSSTPASFGDCAIKALIVVKGDFAGHSSVITNWAPTFHGASV